MGKSEPDLPTRSCGRISTEFLFWYLLSSRPNLIAMGQGGAQPNISQTILKEYGIPLPPLPVQRRIVAKLDSLFDHSKRAREELARIPKLVERYEAAIFAEAATGRLTANWRAGNLNSKHANTVIRSSRSNEKAPFVSADGKALPGSWALCRIGDAGEVTLGRQRAPQHHSGKHMRPYLRVANVFDDRIDISDVMQMNFTPTEFERFCLRKGDILLNEGQSKELVGRAAMFRGEIEGACFTNTLVRFRASDKVSESYALLVFRHYLRAGVFQGIANITTNIAHLGAGRFADLPFPLPPVDEQLEMVRLCAAKLEALDRIKLQVAKAAKEVYRLDQATLAKAFRGSW